MTDKNEIEAGENSPASLVPAEEWREIDGTNYLYEVSSEGRVRSWKQPGSCGLRRRPIILKPRTGSNGYPCITIRQHGIRKLRTIHTVVADAFIERSREGLDVRHLNGDRNDSSINNLALGTRAENFADSARLGTIPLGEKKPNSKLTNDKVHRLRFENDRISDLVAEWGISQSTLDDARSGRTWRHLPMPNGGVNSVHTTARET